MSIADVCFTYEVMYTSASWRQGVWDGITPSGLVPFAKWTRRAGTAVCFCNALQVRHQRRGAFENVIWDNGGLLGVAPRYAHPTARGCNQSPDLSRRPPAQGHQAKRVTSAYQ